MNIKSSFLQVALLFFFSASIWAQKDSVKTEYKQETVTESGRLQNSFCELLTHREQASKDLWKFNLLGTFFGGFNFSYERRLGPAWSLNMHSTTILAHQSASVPILIGEDNVFTSFHQQLSLDARYWLNQKRRIRLNKPVSFSGCYFALSVLTELNNSIAFMNTSSGLVNRINYSLVGTYLLPQFGYQRRIGRIGYLDTHIGLGPGHQFIHANHQLINSQNTLYLDGHIGLGICF